MGRITRRGMEVEFTGLTNSRGQERADCAVLAVAAATGKAYHEAHAALKAAGRKDRCGTHVATTEQAMRAAGKTLRHVSPQYFISRYPGVHKTLRSVTTHHMDRFPEVWRDGKTYLIRVRGHILCVVNGRCLDWSRNKALRVVSILEVL